ncbi:polyamine-transporting ATPase 13A3 isoform X2 [Hydra vulgaris]
MFLRYIICEKTNTIIPLADADKNWKFSDIFYCKNGISIFSVITKLAIYNVNYIDVPIKSYFLIFLELSLDRFYIFQLASITLWFIEDYYLYASFILTMTIISLMINVYMTKKAMQKLLSIIPKAKEVQTLRPIETSLTTSFQVISKSSRELVPGDVLVIPLNGMELPCDAILLNGQCIVNESSLTGESIPSNKIAIEEELNSESFYSVNLHKHNTLFNGTTIVQAISDNKDKSILALVFRTGFYTLKGELIRSIIYPKPVHLKFSSDSMKLLLWISLMAIFGFVYTIVVYKKEGASNSEIITNAFDLITVIIPAALPLILSIGLMVASHRLHKKNIFCIDPNRINICGKVKLALFDKTGTLTDDHASVIGVVPVIKGNIKHFKSTSVGITDTHLFKAMSTCHNLSNVDFKLSGDLIDISMFDFTQYKFHDSNLESLMIHINIPINFKPHIKALVSSENHKPFAILKYFPFESSLQRMSVITINDNDSFNVYTKGSPEKILSLCINDSIPNDIKEEIAKYTSVGNRVLAAAHKYISFVSDWSELNRITRNEIESNLNFSGVIIFENAIKPGTHDTIKILSQANIRTAMATGDDLLTASFVAREINMVTPDQDLIELSFIEENEVYKKLENHKKAIFLEGNSAIELQYSLDYNTQRTANNPKFVLALTGDSYEKIHQHKPHLLPKILVSGTVFSRMSPNQKTALVKDLQNIGYGVCMCGDGANDCGALKAAHTGIALSYAEASIVAPFTSKVFNITCVPTLIMEGRAALVTSFATFKYMILYSMIQFFGVIILYTVRSNFSNNQFIYVDLGLNIPLVLAMTLSKASSKLTLKRPRGRLLHPIFISGIILQILLIIGTLLITFYSIKQMSWYVPVTKFNADKNNTCFENSVVVIVSFYLTIWTSLVCFKGTPYRSPIYQNYVYGILIVVLIAITLYISIKPTQELLNIFSLIEPPNPKHSVLVIGIALSHLVVSFLFERLLEAKHTKRLTNWIRRKKLPKNLYKQILTEMQNQDWPPQE